MAITFFMYNVACKFYFTCTNVRCEGLTVSVRQRIEYYRIIVRGHGLESSSGLNFFQALM